MYTCTKGRMGTVRFVSARPDKGDQFDNPDPFFENTTFSVKKFSTWTCSLKWDNEFVVCIGITSSYTTLFTIKCLTGDKIVHVWRIISLTLKIIIKLIVWSNQLSTFYAPCYTTWTPYFSRSSEIVPFFKIGYRVFGRSTISSLFSTGNLLFKVPSCW